MVGWLWLLSFRLQISGLDRLLNLRLGGKSHILGSFLLLMRRQLNSSLGCRSHYIGGLLLRLGYDKLGRRLMLGGLPLVDGLGVGHLV